jgi:hypothetical protein
LWIRSRGPTSCHDWDVFPCDDKEH